MFNATTDSNLVLIRPGDYVVTIPTAGAHDTHAGKVYKGRVHHVPLFRCSGCAENVWVPDAELLARGFRVAQ